VNRTLYTLELSLNKIVSLFPVEDSKMSMIPVGLFNGLGGIALFWTLMYKNTKQSKYKKYAQGTINHIINRLKIGSDIGYSFGEGYSGIGWLLDYLYRNNVISREQKFVLDTFDPILQKLVCQKKESDYLYNYDFIYGNSGIVLYLLTRLPNPFIKTIIKDYINFINIVAVKDKKTAKWYSLKDIDNSGMRKKVIDISLSHGMSSIMIVLNKIYKQGICKDVIPELIQSGVNYILNQKNTSEIKC
jgi:lantibiotic modifying enzyme